MTPKESYPKYSSGQILKSEDLNDSFNFLEKHIRITRKLMTGYGIFDGLTYEMVNNKLTIQKGQALTRDGYVINIERKQTYDCVVKKENYEEPSDHLSDIDYFFYNKTEDDMPTNESISKIQNISEYVLGIIIEIKSDKRSYCDHVSCNISPERIEWIPRPVLIKKSKVKTFIIDPKALDYVETRRLIGVLEFRNLIILRHRMLKNYKENRHIITDALVSIQKNIPSLFYTDILDKELSTQLQNAISLIKGMADNSTEIPGYYLLFLNDLRMAVNEFVSLYNNFIRNYRLFTLYEPTEKLIILGQIPSIANSEKDEYRTAFKQINSGSTIKSDAEILILAIQRIITLIFSFKQKKYHASKETIKIIPSKYFTSKLGEMSIPFYYNDIELGIWQLGENLSVPVHNHNKFDVNSLTSNFSNDGFFRIDGYFGLKIDTVYEELTKLVKSYDLPFNVVKIKLEKETFSPDKNDDSLSFSFYRKIFSKIISSKHQSIRFPQKWSEAKRLEFKRGLIDIQAVLENQNSVFKKNLNKNTIEDLKKNIQKLILNKELRKSIKNSTYTVFNTLQKHLDFDKITGESLHNLKEPGSFKNFIKQNIEQAQREDKWRKGLATQSYLSTIKKTIDVDGVGYSALSQLSASSLKTLLSCFKNLSPKDIYNYIHGSDATIPEEYYKSEEILAYMGLENFVKKTIIEESTGIEYIGGVKANDTLIILYFHNIAILCLNMPCYLKKIPEKYG